MNIENYIQNINTGPEDIKTSDDKEHLYIWLDILGFSKEVEEQENNEQGKKEIERILNSFREIFIKSLMDEPLQDLDDFKKNNMEKNKKIFSFRINDGRMISDGIVIDVGAFDEIKFDLTDFFIEIGIRQMFFILKHKRLIRGGIALGKTLIGNNKQKSQENEQHYVSSGLTQAYGIESKKVSWPIIATTKSHIKKMQSYMGTEVLFFGLKKTFNKDGEDIYFIDFLEILSKQDDYINFLTSLLPKESEPKEQEKLAICGKVIWLIKHYQKRYGLESEHPFLYGAIL